MKELDNIDNINIDKLYNIFKMLKFYEAFSDSEILLTLSAKFEQEVVSL